jgi:hypothetical protein
MPSVKTGVSFCFVFIANLGLVKRLVRRMGEFCFRYSLVVVDRPVSDQLYLWDIGYGFEY